MKTFNAIQTVKYDLKAAKKTSLKLYHRPDTLRSPVDSSVCYHLQTAYSRSQQKKKQAVPSTKPKPTSVHARAMHIKKLAVKRTKKMPPAAVGLQPKKKKIHATAKHLKEQVQQNNQ